MSFPDVLLASKWTISLHRLAKTFRKTHSFLREKRGRRLRVLSEETLDNTGALSETSRQKPYKTVIPRSRGSKVFSIRNRKISSFESIKFRNCQGAYCVARVWLCYREAVCSDKVDLFWAGFTGQAWFHLNGHVDTRNSQYCSPDQLRLLYKVLLDDIKGGMRCAVSATKIICPILFFGHKKFRT
jgi:hypothetical protein